MTTTAEDLGLDLGWVTFTADRGDEPCIFSDGQDCHREAVVIIIWDRPCVHGPSESPYCADHRDKVLAFGSAPEFIGWLCSVCNAPVTLIRVEPIR